MSFAFELTAEDFANVMRQHKSRLKGWSGFDISAQADKLFEDADMTDLAAIELDALNSGIELDEQTEGAYAAIHKYLVEKDVLTAL